MTGDIFKITMTNKFREFVKKESSRNNYHYIDLIPEYRKHHIYEVPDWQISDKRLGGPSHFNEKEYSFLAETINEKLKQLLKK